MEAIVRDHLRPNSVLIKLPKTVADNLQSNELVVTEQDGYMMIREATISDNNVLIYTGTLTYSSKEAKSYIGKWEVEIEGDWCILENRI